MCREYNRIFKLSIISEQIGQMKTTDSALLGIAVVHLFKKEKKTVSTCQSLLNLRLLGQPASWVKRLFGTSA